jgi:glucose uptake protein GlcU
MSSKFGNGGASASTSIGLSVCGLWSVFFHREWKRNWPFLTGFAITGFIITKMTANFTEEDLKNSKFVQEHKKR